jgi:hypothetical protein
MNRISRFARSPQGRRLTSRAMTMAKHPKTRAKIQQFRQRRAGGR